jgi:hypothetical protein
VIDLGGGTGAADLKISNVSTDPTSGSPALTELSLLAADFQGEPSGFALENFVADTVLSEGSSFDLVIDFNAAFGMTGQTFDYQVVADALIGGDHKIGRLLSEAWCVLLEYSGPTPWPESVTS